jgi:hypothetical protein
MSDNLKMDEGKTESDQPQSVRAGPDLARRTAMFQLLTAGTGLAAIALLAPRRAHAAYGKCTVNGCYCCHYQGNADNCSNCGHQYPDHGGATC